MVLGTYKEAVSARATDKDILKVSQDGGIVSALLIQAIEDGIIEGAVVAGKYEGEKWRPVPSVATTKEEILEAAGTRYTMSPTLAGLKNAVRQEGLEKVGICLTPCQTLALRKVQAYPFSTRFVADKVKLAIGIFCMENFPIGVLDTFSEAKLGTPKDEVDKMDIGKGKFWIQSNGEEKGLGLKFTHGYEQAGCNVCTDYVAEFSDISTGSVGSPDGWSTVLKRTDAGSNIFKAAVDSGLIEIKPMDDVKPGLPLLEKLAKGKKDKGQKELERRESLGLQTPLIL